MQMQRMQMQRMHGQVEQEQLLMPVDDLVLRACGLQSESSDETSWRADEPLQNPEGPTREDVRDHSEDRYTRRRKT